MGFISLNVEMYIYSVCIYIHNKYLKYTHHRMILHLETSEMCSKFLWDLKQCCNVRCLFTACCDGYVDTQILITSISMDLLFVIALAGKILMQILLRKSYFPQKCKMLE